ncbi:helix-turn-helix domain-containing protein [Streptomyces sp. NPDC056010]|uniref:helix-turn-helix domain-containing protein n=1 Tax=Streptomyces sp. NPDC056010 TaxID=3345679 RepID=UPI0035E0C0F1
MKNLYERLAATTEGSRALASARLRYEALASIHDALGDAGITQVELARRLGIRKSAVNQVVHGDGNLRISTLAEYLHALGFELKLERVESGKPREQVIASRPHVECDDDREKQYVSWADDVEVVVTHRADPLALDREPDEPMTWESFDDSVIEHRLVQV